MIMAKAAIPIVLGNARSLSVLSPLSGIETSSERQLPAITTTSNRTNYVGTITGLGNAQKLTVFLRSLNAR